MRGLQTTRSPALPATSSFCVKARREFPDVGRARLDDVRAVGGAEPLHPPRGALPAHLSAGAAHRPRAGCLLRRHQLWALRPRVGPAHPRQQRVGAVARLRHRRAAGDGVALGAPAPAAAVVGAPVGAGVYLYQLQAKDFVKTRKMVLLK